MKKALEVSSLYKRINKSVILNNVNICVEQNSICGITGRNASGKSMFFKTIVGLAPYDEGDVKILGRSVDSADALQCIGALIEYPGLLPQFSAWNNLEMIAKMRDAYNRSYIYELMDSIGLEYNDTRAIKKYSLGMRQKVGIIAALLTKPELIILDEPMNNLDAESIILVRELIRQQQKHGATILISSHSREDIDELCDDVYLMNAGHLSSIEANSR